MTAESARRAEDLVAVSRRLCAQVDGLQFGSPVAVVYNPLDYARAPHETYLRRFGGGVKKAVFMGMNPGPWGMAQTGIPFGDVVTVRDWLDIRDPVRPPITEHPKRPVLGLDCGRVEVSGRRLWSWIEAVFTTPESFFADHLVINYCPLIFLEAGGRNRTPDRLPAAERAPLLEACDEGLRRTIEVLEPELLIGVGRFARLRAEQALGAAGPRIGEVLHPSPASPAANRGWAEKATAQLADLGLGLPSI